MRGRSITPGLSDTSEASQRPAAPSNRLFAVGGTTAAATRGQPSPSPASPPQAELRRRRHGESALARARCATRAAFTGARRPEVRSDAEARARRLCPVRSGGKGRAAAGRAGPRRAGPGGGGSPVPQGSAGRLLPAGVAWGASAVLAHGAGVPRFPSASSPGCGAAAVGG